MKKMRGRAASASRIPGVGWLISSPRRGHESIVSLLTGANAVWKKVGKIAVAILILIGIGWFALGIAYRYRVTPPEGVRTLDDFLAAMPIPAHAEIFLHSESEYLQLTGFVDLQAMLAVVSGPPVYIFDRSGTLVDWTTDDGDDEAFHHRWGKSQVRRIGIDEAKGQARVRR